MVIHDAIRRLQALPTAGLGHWPTPLHRLDRFSELLDTDIWIKRDDIQGVALAGNKIRKFDLVIGDAQSRGKDTLVTTGAPQSNSARTGAAAAAAAGLSAYLLLSGSAPEEPTANLLIDHLVGARVRYAGDATWDELNAGVNDIVAELHRKGRKPFAAPLGCSSPLGALGFAKAYLEIHAQFASAGVEPSAIVHTSTSGGTHAGLLVGRALAHSTTRIIGIDVGAIHDQPAHALAGLAAQAADLIGLDLGIAPADLEITTDQIGDGYAVPTESGNAAIRQLAHAEGVLVDPVYSGKGLAGFIDLVAGGRIEGPVVFWHTGGYHALFEPALGTPVVGSAGAG
jgi:1-aminocyclopropane-1-carboxylate deaminase/D-cysteine desulfhydrase